MRYTEPEAILENENSVLFDACQNGDAEMYSISMTGLHGASQSGVGVDLDESLKEEPSSQQASSIKSWIKHGLVHCSSVLLEYIAKGAISKMGCLC
ncbi:solute carrier family 9 (sodium/hydrogen exchanger), isoform 9, isoform CRA_b [Mus musculus]|nr:solute carrier family 9 (sodium/hydrogen exchanger), isoform 9, isoform CRA_b [Mus musculus]